ncbi:GNAT family N-acetyltransferase [Kibdelosporangium phytohabitans]|uniref:GNAT family N-acetyltransferase n=1 Tax=Kibdelosporangium phytohabitans TaxID=860235 RepID=UPI0019E9B1B6|nr:GNAT family N-acetyltransferase [Kibdelosporangium phytohabitans]MBE1464926.1 GNAT superfamily N-acetyltransferase [Kibdelosporangium phytohabitans]
MIIRERTADDVDACVKAVAEVHAADRYPTNWPAEPAGWLNPDGLVGSWVAESDGVVLGHVALQQGHGPCAVPAVLDAAGVEPARLAAVARLFVVPAARRQGVAAALMDAVGEEAAQRGLRLVLDTVGHAPAALAFYERTGWRRVLSQTASWTRPGGGEVTMHYYLGPDRVETATR